MNTPPHNPKAGPTQGQPRWNQQTSTRRRHAAKAIVLVAALLLGCMTFVSVSRDGLDSDWLWRMTGQSGNENEHERAKGSQYLLGVGKADITGLDSSISSAFARY